MAKLAEFWSWVDREIQARGLSYYRIEREARLPNAAISRAARGMTQPSPAACLALAQAFEIEPEDVFRKAGILPPLPRAVAEEREAVSILRRLPAAARSMVLMMLRALKPLQVSSSLPSRQAEARREAGRTGDDDDLLERQVMEEFRSLPPEFQAIAVDEVKQVRQLATRMVRIIGNEDTESDNESPGEEAAEEASG